jgi:hypothetical protein
MIQFHGGLGSYLALCFGLILSPALVQAQDFQGAFVSDNGFDHVVVHKRHVQASAVSASGNLCDVDGDYKSSGWVVASHECQFKLIPLANGGFKIDLPNESGCDAFCGANVSISGEYKPVPPACDNQRFEHSLAVYRSQNHQQQYEAAYQTFSKTLSTCKPFIDFLTHDKAASELSLSLKQLGRGQDCQRLLSQTRAHGQTEATLKEFYPPVMFDSYIRTARTIWFNAKACGDAL